MRRSSDLPRRRRVSGRVVLIAVFVVIVFVLIFGRAIAGFYINYLWHSSLDRSDVFWGRIVAQLTLFGMFFGVFALLTGVNLFIADRLAPSSFPANVHPYVERFHEMFGQRLRLLRYGVAVVLAILFALPTTSQWQNWLMFRNATNFGESDPQFGADVGFYMFQLPFLSFLLDWVFITVLVVLLITVVAHLLNGGVVFASPMPAMRNATKAHLAVLIALLAAVRAAIYWLSRYEMTNDRRGFVQGATYAVVNAQLPAVMLLLLIAVLTAVLFLVSIRTGSWRLPLMASALWVVVALFGSVIYPAVIQALVVNPNQQGREATYIERNMDATRTAYGLEEDDVRVEDMSFGSLTAEDLEENIDALRDVRLLNPEQFRSRFVLDYGDEAGFTINDLDIDRYMLEDRPEQVLMAARELHPDGIPNRSWQGRHLIYTRGCGLVLAPTSVVGADDNPESMEIARDTGNEIEIEQPELYFSPDLAGYAIVNTTEAERSCDDIGRTGEEGAELQQEEYTGEYGVEISSIFQRGAFALSFLDYNIMGSGAIGGDSQMLWRRDVRDRAEALAPFLEYDGDPYPVVVDVDGDGSRGVQWIIDAYTTSSRYPYSQRIGDVQLTEETGLSPSDNYVRNSVKVAVDAYDGSVAFYRMDDPDDPEPVLETWDKVFPDLFTPSDEIPDELREHFRYPEDLFRVQTELYSKYFLPTASQFFSRSNAWSVAQAPSANPSDVTNGTATPAQGAEEATVDDEFATESGSERFQPYYTYFHDPETGEEDFVLYRPFVPFSRDDRRTELRSYMTASSDPDNYGELVVYDVEETAPGPLQVMRDMEASQDIGEAITLLSRGNRQVRFGDFQILPVGDGLLYVRPFYVLVATNNSEVPNATEYRFVMVNYNGESAFGTSLRDALDDPDLFPGFATEVGDRPDDVEDVDDLDLSEGEGGGTVDGGVEGEDPGDDEPSDTTDAPEDTDVSDTTEPEETDPSDTTTPATIDDDATPEELLEVADRLYAEAEDDLRDGDLGSYQAKVDEASGYVTRALALLTDEE